MVEAVGRNNIVSSVHPSALNLLTVAPVEEASTKEPPISTFLVSGEKTYVRLISVVM